MDRLTVWGAMCLLVGCGFAINALLIYRQRRRFLATAEPATGTVVEVHVRGAGRNRVVVPVFDFHMADGAVRRAESLMGSGFRGFAVGEQLAVRYDPADPSRAEVDSFAVLWGLVLLRAGFAALFLLMGTVGLVVS